MSVLSILRRRELGLAGGKRRGPGTSSELPADAVSPAQGPAQAAQARSHPLWALCHGRAALHCVLVAVCAHLCVRAQQGVERAQ